MNGWQLQASLFEVLDEGFAWCEQFTGLELLASNAGVGLGFFRQARERIVNMKLTGKIISVQQPPDEQTRRADITAKFHNVTSRAALQHYF